MNSLPSFAAPANTWRTQMGQRIELRRRPVTSCTTLVGNTGLARQTKTLPVELQPGSLGLVRSEDGEPPPSKGGGYNVQRLSGHSVYKHAHTWACINA